MLRTFGPSMLITLLALGIGAYYGGLGMLTIVAVLIVLEISLSFDNAVVNAKVLQRMSPVWQKIFLTVGIAIAVFGMRLVLPVVIVAVVTGMGPIEVVNMALDNPEQYQASLETAKEGIYAFGGIFLLMIFLNFVLDPERDIHWLAWVEKPLAKAGNLSTLPVLIALLALYGSSQLATTDKTTTVLVSGLFGLVVYLAVNGLDILLNGDDDDENSGVETDGAGVVTKMTFAAGLSAFLYLEMLDASFSLDGVIGAFAVSNDILVIALGLGVGAFWVRSMTIYLVRKGTLAEYIYLEHGAHWAIGVLAAIMLIGMKYHVSEYVTGLGGVAFIAVAVISSVIEKRRVDKHNDTNGDVDAASGASEELASPVGV